MQQLRIHIHYNNTFYGKGCGISEKYNYYYNYYHFYTNLLIEFSVPTPPLSTFCNIQHVNDAPAITFIWSSSFNALYRVEMYRVTVSPDPSSCSRTQSQTDGYICSGLTLGISYNITITAINCGDEDGDSLNFSVGPPPQGINS